ncbi:Lipoprotein-releasing system transmembrane protein LolE [BD1-7 clade bacterium]|uniref:Lipoprotein-releasing system transmembrane protein LolE n=1 Tax=BD1-7 clade bacterium TaxID=2029982 RepID=A0A5S9QW79_9GAMM|nr:Lipoprotein-releasing system transmembrane protein LolE [BD1-7 clade bacterium]
MNSLSLFIGFRYTLSRRQSHLVAFISRVSTAGMVLAVAVLITVTSVMNGFDRELRERILAIVPHATVQGYKPITDWQDKVQIAQAHEGVEEAVPFSIMQGLLMSGGKVKSAIVYGVDDELEPKHSVLYQTLGGDALKTLSQAKTLVLGARLAVALSVGIGDSVNLVLPPQTRGALPKTDTFTVTALVNSGTELDEKLVLMHRRSIAAFRRQPAESVDGIRLYMTDLFDARNIANQVSEMTSLYYVSDWTRTHGNLYQAVQMSRKLVLLMVFIIVAVAAFNVVSTLVLAVNDKASDIAILRTLGCNNRQILNIFVVQGVVIGITGVALGVLFGVLSSLLVSDGVVLLESLTGIQFLDTRVYPVDHLPSAIHLSDVITICVVALGLSLVASVLPAWQAIRLHPATVLRYE